VFNPPGLPRLPSRAAGPRPSLKNTVVSRFSSLYRFQGPRASPPRSPPERALE